MRIRRLVIGVLAIAAPTAACTLLVEFKDAPLGNDAGDASVVGTADAKADGGLDAAPVNTADARPCVGPDGKNLSTGWYCAGNKTGAWPGSKDILFRCEAGAAEQTFCDGGCAVFRDGVPDRCDPCPGRPNGAYCGSEVGWTLAKDQELAKFLIQCVNGDLAGGSTECGTSCNATTHKCVP